MKVVKTIFWLLLATVLVLFAVANWLPVEVSIGGGLVLETKLPPDGSGGRTPTKARAPFRVRSRPARTTTSRALTRARSPGEQSSLSRA
jgi:hypothetical protein